MDNPRSRTSVSVVIVDDEPSILRSASAVLGSAGIEDVVTLRDSRTVLPFLEKNRAWLMILDLSMPHIDGMELLEKVNADHPETTVIIMTATNEVETAIRCMKAGAIDYLVKPIEESQLVSSVKRALDLCALRQEVSLLKKKILSEDSEEKKVFSPIRTISKKMRSVFLYAEVIAVTTQPVLITGETGVGKELIARAIHRISALQGDLVAVNVAGLDDPLFSDTLFGHVKGAYTDAGSAREGMISKASGGTLFLDEIGDLSLLSQVKLLRLLQQREYFPLGSDVSQKSNARIIASTNQDLQQLIDHGKFRKDLFFRLMAHQIVVPPLRERMEDLPLLLQQFLEVASSRLNKPLPRVSRELFGFLSAYPFPGNVRELDAMVHDALARNTSGELSSADFQVYIAGKKRTPSANDVFPGEAENRLVKVLGHFPTLKEMDALLMRLAINSSNENRTVAASMLGITRQALNKRLRQMVRSQEPTAGRRSSGQAGKA